MKNFLIILSFFSISAFSQDIVIRNVNIVDVVNGKIDTDKAVLISDGEFTWIGPDIKFKAGNSVIAIDGQSKYLMPGLIDSHIHFFQSGGLYTRPDAADFTHIKPYSVERNEGFKNAADYLKRYLKLGITTVVDDGGPLNNFAIRDSVSKTFKSPNILVTGPLFSMVDRKKLEYNDAPIIKVTSREEIDKLFNKMLPYEPDFIKIWYVVTKELPAEQTFPLVKYIGELCTQNKLRLAVHATELKTAQLAVEAGANILVHSIDDVVIPADFIKTLKDKKVTYLPTLIVGHNYARAFSGKRSNHAQDLLWANPSAYGSLSDTEHLDSAKFPSVVRRLRKNGIPKANSTKDSIMRINLKNLVNAGVNVATGTDAGNIGTLHASSYLQELEAMQKAGMTLPQILKASTINAATGFGMADKIGVVEKGKIADAVLLSENPFESLHNLTAIEMVFRGGVNVMETIKFDSPEEVVQRQVNAYNARNIDLFVATYADDVEIYDNKGNLTIKGHDQLRAGYEGFFRSTENLHCQIENRIVYNNKVIDKEKVRAGSKIIHGLAQYEVENGKIKTVRFLE